MLPVFRNPLGSDNVSARGIIYGGSNPVACGTVARSTSKCYSTVSFIDITRLLNAWEVTIETS